LTAAAAGILESDPPRSLSFAQLALAVASTIPAETYPSPVQAHIEGRAWKEIGTAHRYLDAYDAALRAYVAAHRSFANECSLVHEQTRAEYGRAVILTFCDSDDEALSVLDEITKVFKSFGDETLVANCQAVKAVITCHRGDLKTALEINLELLAKSATADDLYGLGVVHINIGHIQTLLGNTSEAVDAFQRAREIYTVLGMPSEVDRADWGLATILLNSGSFPTALPLLYRLRDAYLARKMPKNAGLIALLIVDALVATDRRDEALQLTEQVLAEFVIANIDKHAVTALAYLRDLLPTTKHARRHIHHVRSYVKHLGTGTELLFLPLDAKD
jgi:tetratricopeptide (TPR) repeat protein